LAAAPFSQGLMAECGQGEIVAARIAGVAREAQNLGELLWLDAQGQTLPGWPVAFVDLMQAISHRSEPLLVRRGAEQHVLAATKTHLVELDRTGQLCSQASCNGLPLGPPVLLPIAGAGVHCLIYVQQQEQASLLQFDASLQHVAGVPLPGQPAWPRPVLGDYNGDGRLDVLMLLRQGGGLQLHMLDGASGELDLLHVLPDMEIVSIASGDLDGDLVPDLVLAARRGPVLALDLDGLKWSAAIPAATLGQFTLADLDGDGAQEVALLCRHDDGAVRLQVLNASGAFLPLAGFVVATEGKAVQPPQLVRDAVLGPRLLLTIDPAEDAWATRLMAVDLAGHVEERDWWLPEAPNGPPRLTDLDGDGSLDLVAGDRLGRWVAWPTGWQDLRPPHPLGDRRRGALTLQPLPPGTTPDLLGGAVALPESGLDLADVELMDLELVRGSLRLSGELLSQGGIWVGPLGSLSLDDRCQPACCGRLPLAVEGRFELRGTGVVAQMPQPGIQTPANNLLSTLQLTVGRGAHLSFRQCLLHALPEPLAVQACTLSIEHSWLLAGTRGLWTRGVTLRARDCLFQPGTQGLRFQDASDVLLEDCVITSGTGVAVVNRASRLELRGCQVLTCEDGLVAEAGAVMVLDSVHFQGNRRDLILATDHGDLTLQNCDFVESHDVGLLNHSSSSVTATACHWNLQCPTEGPVIRESDRAQPVKPLIIPRPVFAISTGPMVDGDEPLEWDPVDISVGGIPISVEYRIYRSSQPYGLVRLENLAATTSLTRWRDPHYQPICFYCVTASIGKQVVE
jgi:hypothetical protein